MQQIIITVKEDLKPLSYGIIKDLHSLNTLTISVGGADINVVVVEVDDAEQEAKAPQGYTVEVLRDFEVLSVSVGGADISVVVVEVDDAEQEAKALQGYTVEVQ